MKFKSWRSVHLCSTIRHHLSLAHCAMSGPPLYESCQCLGCEVYVAMIIPKCQPMSVPNISLAFEMTIHVFLHLQFVEIWTVLLILSVACLSQILKTMSILLPSGVVPKHAIFFTAVCQRDLHWVIWGPLFAVSFIVVFLPWRMRFFITTVEFHMGSMICNPSA